MKIIHTPHDRFFRETFGDVDVATEFINHFLPEEILGIIDVTTLKPLKDSFIEKEMKDSYSDLLFHTKFGDREGYLYFLFEHKSYEESDIALQLLGYMADIWKQKRKKEKAVELPIILPIVFYHGKTAWRHPKTIADWIGDYQLVACKLQRYVPNFDFLLYDFSPRGEQEIKGGPKLRAYLELAKHIFSEDYEQLIYIIVRLECVLQQHLEYFDTIILYVFSVYHHIPQELLKERLTVEGRKRVMTIAERLRQEGRQEGIREGRQEGIREGVEEGKRKKAIEMARELLFMDMNEEQILRVTKLSQEELTKIKQELK